MTEATDEKLYRVLSQVFGVSPDQIKENSSPDNLPNWDSVSHINMIVSLEAEFGVNLLPEDALEMLSVKLIRLILKDKGVQGF